MLQELLRTNRKPYSQSKSDANFRKLYEFDKDTEFLLSQITPESSFIIPEKDRKIQNSKSYPEKTTERSQNHHHHEHTKCSYCIQCHPYLRQLKKQRNRLVNFINNNKIKNIKLIGNYRYNNSSPEKYVIDNRRQIPDRRMGLIPVPVKKKKKKDEKFDKKSYYELQRSIVMMRRIQYDRRITKIKNGDINYFLDDVIFIQTWWRQQKKAKIIQKKYREYLKRKREKIKNNLKKNINNIDNIIKKIIFKKVLNKINDYKYIKRPVILYNNYNYNKDYNKNYNNNYSLHHNFSFGDNLVRKDISDNNVYYISKIRKIKIKPKIIKKQNNINEIKDIKNKSKPQVKKNLFTKVSVNPKLLNNKITMLQRNIRYFLNENKKKNMKIIKRAKIKPSYGIYIDKKYINNYLLKVIDFNKKLKHALQLKVFRKKEEEPKSKYKNIKDYNLDDINNIAKIQKTYKEHYNKYHINKKDLIKIYSNKLYLNCYISKKRINKNDQQLLLLQRAMKKAINKIKLEKNIIKNKPRSENFVRKNNDFIISSMPKLKMNNLGISNNTDNFSFKGLEKNKKSNNRYDISPVEDINIISSREFNKNNINISSSREFNLHNINYNLAYYISKINIINVNDKLILLQRKIKTYLYLKKAKVNYYNNNNCLYIKKVHINKMFYITKENSNQKECLEKLKEIQLFYKKRFSYMKNNIINYIANKDDKLMLSRNDSFNIFANYNDAVRNSIKKLNNDFSISNNNISYLNDKGKVQPTFDKDLNISEINSYAIKGNKKPKNRRQSYQVQLQINKLALLSELILKNRKPIINNLGSYYQKIRIDGDTHDELMKKRNQFALFINIRNRGQYISKSRFVDNSPQIKLIQREFKNRKNFKKFQKEKEKNMVIAKPIIQNYVVSNTLMNENSGRNSKENNMPTRNKNKLNHHRKKQKEKEKEKEKRYDNDNENSNVSDMNDNIIIKRKDMKSSNNSNSNSNINSNSDNKNNSNIYSNKSLKNSNNSNNNNLEEIENEEKEDNDEIEEKEDKEDSYFESIDREYLDFVGEKIYTIYNKRNMVRQPHLYMNNYYMITKIRRYNDQKDFNTEKEYIAIKNDLKERRLNNKNNNEEELNYSSPPNQPNLEKEKSQKLNIEYKPITKDDIDKKDGNNNKASEKKEKEKDSLDNNEKNDKTRNKKKGKENPKTFQIENPKLSQKESLKKDTKNSEKITVKEKEREKMMNNIAYHSIKSFNEKKEEKPCKKSKNEICYIRKIRFKNENIIKLIKNIKVNQKENGLNKINKYLYKDTIDNSNKFLKQKGRNINNNSSYNYIINVTYIKPINNICYISKFRINNNNKEIADKKIRNNKEQNFLLNDLKINNALNKMQIIDKNNFENNRNKINNSINFENNKSKDHNSNLNSSLSEKVSNGNNVVSHSNESKVKTKRNFYNININDKISYFHNKINYIYFIQLLNLFVIKNTQEYYFYKLYNYYKKNYNISTDKNLNLYNNFNFSFPFYIRALKRLFIYCKKENNQNRRLKCFLNLIFPSLSKNKSLYYLLICLTIENKKKLYQTNLYNINNEQNILIQFLDDFAKFDKQISNKDFITNKITNNIFYNTNIFTLVKFVDDEYNKLKNGKYCKKCYKYENMCDCSQKCFNNYISEDDVIDLDINEDSNSSRKIVINCFVNDNNEDVQRKNQNQIICIKKKSNMNNIDNNSSVTLMFKNKD